MFNLFLLPDGYRWILWMGYKKPDGYICSITAPSKDGKARWRYAIINA